MEDSLVRLGAISVEVNPVVPSPKPYGYRSKLTPHYQGGRQGEDLTIGFLKQGSRRALVDVKNCPIATDAINQALPEARNNLKNVPRKKRGGYSSFTEVLEGVVTDSKLLVSERVGELIFHFRAGEFFQNNPLSSPSWLIMWSLRQTVIKILCLLMPTVVEGFLANAALSSTVWWGSKLAEKGLMVPEPMPRSTESPMQNFSSAMRALFLRKSKKFLNPPHSLSIPQERVVTPTFFVRQ